MANYQVSTTTPSVSLAAFPKRGPVRALEEGTIIISGKILFGGTGSVSSVTGYGLSAASAATGVVTVAFPPCKQINGIQLTPQVSGGYTGTLSVSAVSAGSGTLTFVAATGGAAANFPSGGYVYVTIEARESKFA